MSLPKRPVMVGVDGSSGSADAIELGAWEARRRHRPLLLIRGCDGSDRTEAYAMLTDIEMRTHARHHGLAVRASVVGGGGASTLVELSRGACLVVVGARGTGGFAGLPLGSVSTQVATHAHAPVIVARTPTEGPVVVGVDGSPGGATALGFAFDEASARGVPLMALYAHPDDPSPIGFESDALAGWSEKYPDVTVRPVVRRDLSAAPALIEAGRTAGMVVVGSRGRGGFAGMVLGSVSRMVVTHAHCPVAVAREIEE